MTSEEAYEPSLYWDASYEIVLALMKHYPHINVEAVGVHQLKALILALPGFADDPALAHDDLLCQILREWYEELDAALFDDQG